MLRRHGDDLRIDIVAFDERWGDQPDEQGRQVFSTTQRSLRVGRVVRATAQGLLDDLGAADYERQRGGHPFSSAALERLRRAIQAQRAPESS